MIITAEQKYIRQTPRKLRLIANTVKEMPLEKALNQLAVIEKRATLAVMKVVKQAVANAMNNHGLTFKDLVLTDILVTEGPRFKRFRAVSRGRAHEVLKRTSHVKVRLTTTSEAKPQVVKAKKAEVTAELVTEKTKDAGRSSVSLQPKASPMRLANTNKMAKPNVSTKKSNKAGIQKKGTGS